MAQQQQAFPITDGAAPGQTANPTAPDRSNMFEECYCQTNIGLAGARKPDVEVKQQSARAVFQQPVPRELSHVFLHSMGGKPIRDLLQDNVVAHLNDNQKAQYSEENRQYLGADVGAFGAAAVHGAHQHPDVVLDLPEHNQVAAAEAGIECNMIQTVWSKLSVDQRSKLDAELDAKLRAAKANRGAIDYSLPAEGTALAQFDASVISLVRDYLRKR